MEHQATYHPSCKKKFNILNLSRASTSQTRPVINEPVTRRRVPELPAAPINRHKRAKTVLGERICMFRGVIPQCGAKFSSNLPPRYTAQLRPDPENDLKAAGQSNKVGESTSKLGEVLQMATAMNEGVILSRLSVGDANANELFYHLKCWSAYKYMYDNHKRESEPYEEVADDVMSKAYALNDVITFIVENHVKHKLVDLVRMYNSKLQDTRFHFHHSKTLPFRLLLEEHIPLLKHEIGPKKLGTVVFLEVSISRGGIRGWEGQRSRGVVCDSLGFCAIIFYLVPRPKHSFYRLLRGQLHLQSI